MTETIQIHICDRCGKNQEGLNRVNGSELCIDCYTKFMRWWNHYLDPGIDETFKPNNKIKYTINGRIID